MAQEAIELLKKTCPLAPRVHREAGRPAEHHDPAEDPDFDGLTQAFPAWAPPERDTILQPPKPQITPSGRIVELTADRNLDREPVG